MGIGRALVVVVVVVNPAVAAAAVKELLGGIREVTGGWFGGA